MSIKMQHGVSNKHLLIVDDIQNINSILKINSEHVIKRKCGSYKLIVNVRLWFVRRILIVNNLIYIQ